MAYITDLPNIIIVRSMEDLPPPVAGVISLNAGTRYTFPGPGKTFDFSGNILEFGASTFVEFLYATTDSSFRAAAGGSINIDSSTLTYTGAGTFLTSTDLGAVSELRRVTINCATGTVFGIASTTPNQYFPISSV